MSGLTVERCDELAAVEKIWRELASRSGNPFLTWEWAATWWRHYGGRRRPLLAVCRDDQDPVALLPLCLDVRPVRLVRWIGHGQSDLLGPVCAPHDSTRALVALSAALDDVRGWDLLLAEDFPAGTAWPTELPTRTLRRLSSPVLATEGRSWEEFLASRSRNLRDQVRRKERKLAREHELRFRLTTDRDWLGRDLDVLFALHRARWGARAEGGFAGPDEAFHRDFAEVALEQGWLRLWTMELDGEPVAAWYGFRFGGVEWYYQAGRDPDWERASIGFVLLSHSIRAAFEDGVREYRFLRGGESYKDRFTGGGHDLETVAVPNGALGRAAVVAALAARRLPSHWRSYLAGR